MKHLILALVLLFGSGICHLLSLGPINESCPVKGNEINVTAQFNNECVGFCCEKCIGVFSSDQSSYSVVDSRVVPYSTLALLLALLAAFPIYFHLKSNDDKVDICENAVEKARLG